MHLPATEPATERYESRYNLADAAMRLGSAATTPLHQAWSQPYDNDERAFLVLACKERLIAEMMHVLDERFDTLANSPFVHLLARVSAARILVAR